MYRPPWGVRYAPSSLPAGFQFDESKFSCIPLSGEVMPQPREEICPGGCRDRSVISCGKYIHTPADSDIWQSISGDDTLGAKVPRHPMTATLIQYLPSGIIKIIDILDLTHITGGHEPPRKKQIPTCRRRQLSDVHIFGRLIVSPRASREAAR